MGHEHFVGRTWELAGLGAEFIGSSDGAEVKPVAVITGLGGMGKTALAAEALALWQARFAWVLLYQSKSNRLDIDMWLRDLHLKLNAELGRYYDHVKSSSPDAIYREASAEFTGAERYERLTRNLLRALKDEAILLVLDNFETNLKPQAELNATGGEPSWACQDENWDRCLTLLAAELIGTRSRVLITCRRPLAALEGTAFHPVLLGPLPPGEAALYLREHAGLSRMFFSADKKERELAERLLKVSRFHPLLMDRLARLAVGGAKLREQLLQALATLENRKDFAQLPALFATTPGDAKELAYLRDALEASLDQLIQEASPDARRLLWLIAVANEPIELDLLKSVWSATPAWFDPALPLPYLVALGLVTEERKGPEDENPDLTCHELVRERIRNRMEAHPQERANLTENGIRLAYAERLAGAFKALQHQSMIAALQSGSRALAYCVQAGDYDRLGAFASSVVTSASDPRLLEALLPHLQAATESAPAGERRWFCLGNLADALNKSGRPDASLPFYEQAATQARSTADASPAGSETARQGWAHVGWISGNWANALRAVGEHDAAHQRWLESAKAAKKAGRPAVYVTGSELEGLRIQIMQGQAAEALPQVESRLEQVEQWWRQHRSGQPVPEAPDPESLARAYISALDIARTAHFAQRDWKAALPRIDAMMEVMRELRRPAEDIAVTRMNRANVLVKIQGRVGEARAELEACLQVLQHDPAGRASVLGSLADLFDKQGDPAHAIVQTRRALALCESVPDPRYRALAHQNLANYLERSGLPADLAESPGHQLAALVYRLTAGLGRELQFSLRNYAIRFRRAHAAGKKLTVPRVAELLADPAFRPLAEWLVKQQVDVDELRSKVDTWLEQVRQQALE